MPSDRLAKVAYAAYSDHLHYPIDEWDELKSEIRGAWCAAADAVVMTLGTKPEESLEKDTT